MNRVLVYTSLFPTAQAPVHGIFVQELTQALARLMPVEVLALRNGWRAAPWRRAELSQNFPVRGSAFFAVPKVFKNYDDRLVAFWSRKAFDKARLSKPSLVHAHYAYPDAAAAAILCRERGLPLVVTAHGSDINVLAHCCQRRHRIVAALRQAAAVVAVSRALAEKVESLGVDPARIVHIPNGVNLSLFHPGDKAAARLNVGVPADCPVVLAVGRLEPVKGYDRLIAAMRGVRPDAVLVLVGDGSQRSRLENQALRMGLGRRVLFTGLVGRDRLPDFYRSADLLALSSFSEGWPTILFEAMACGLPIVAPMVGGIGEALDDPALGIVTRDNDPGLLAEAIGQALAQTWDKSAIVRAPLKHSWEAAALRYREVFSNVLKDQGGGSGPGPQD